MQTPDSSQILEALSWGGHAARMVERANTGGYGLNCSVVSQPLLVISTEGRDLLSVLNAKISRIRSK